MFTPRQVAYVYGNPEQLESITVGDCRIYAQFYTSSDLDVVLFLTAFKRGDYRASLSVTGISDQPDFEQLTAVVNIYAKVMLDVLKIQG